VKFTFDLLDQGNPRPGFLKNDQSYRVIKFGGLVGLVVLDLMRGMTYDIQIDRQTDISESASTGKRKYGNGKYEIA